MKCLNCKFEDTKVIDSRITENGKSIRRRRECPNCGYRFTTIEKMQNAGRAVIKKDGKKEPYDREKLKKSIMIAFAKRDFDIKKIDEMLDALEAQRANMGAEISSKKIGEDVLDMIKKIDEIAYLRFASVYKDVESIEDFLKLIAKDFDINCQKCPKNNK